MGNWLVVQEALVIDDLDSEHGVGVKNFPLKVRCHSPFRVAASVFLLMGFPNFPALVHDPDVGAHSFEFTALVVFKMRSLEMQLDEALHTTHGLLKDTLLDESLLLKDTLLLNRLHKGLRVDIDDVLRSELSPEENTASR